MEERVHIGELIQKRLDEQGMSVTEFARRLNIRSQSIYPMLKKSSINTAQLQKIGEILKYDFFQHYVEVKEGSQKIISATHPGLSVIINVADKEKEQKILKLLGISIR